MHIRVISKILKNFKGGEKMKKMFFGAISGLLFLLTCTDNPPTTAKIEMSDDESVKSTADMLFPVTAIVADSEDETIRYNNFKVRFLCTNCEFENDDVTNENLIGEFNPTDIEKRTDSYGTASVSVRVKVGVEAYVSGSLENGSSDSTKLTVSAQ